MYKPRISQRTDLAIEAHELCEGFPEVSGVETKFTQRGDLRITDISITTEESAQKIGKPQGRYITVEMPPLTDNPTAPEVYSHALSEYLVKMLPGEGEVLIVGMGNSEITPDALGPRSASGILATRHLLSEFSRTAGLDELRATSVLAPGVLGQTGIEVVEIIRALSQKLKLSAVIVIDALAARSLERLGRTIQISNTGISPGAGVGNNRPQINSQTLGVPVIAIGMPTVVDAATLAYDIAAHAGEDTQQATEMAHPGGEVMIVTPSEIDLLIDRGAKLIALGVNGALHPKYDPVELMNVI